MSRVPGSYPGVQDRKELFAARITQPGS